MSGLLQYIRSSSARSDLEALLVRMRQRQYPETMPVLASYWLKTVYASGHQRGWWKDLNENLKQALGDQVLDTASREALTEIQKWVEERGLPGQKTPGNPHPGPEPFRANLRPDALGPYIRRLLNEWLSAEVASLLVEESEFASPPDAGIPVLAVGRALERLLVRERLSPGTLELFLQPELLSPLDVYPADAEMLRDVVLALLGRTWAPTPPVMPATVLGLAMEGFVEPVRNAVLVQAGGCEEIRVRNIPAANAPVLLTMDGRWWEPESLQAEGGPLIYTPGGRLRIDFSAEHVKLLMPSPRTPLQWSGTVHFGGTFRIFGREWRAASWENDGERSSLNLVFSRFLPIVEIHLAAEAGFRRSHPAGVDIAWAAMENALATAISQKSREPIERLHRPDFVPLGRALLGLVESTHRLRLPKRETIETQLRAVGYHEAEISGEYGRVPWRILPNPVRTILLKRYRDPALLDLLHQVFDGLPEVRGRRSTSPPQAA